MDFKTMEKIEASFCCLWVCDKKSCPFSPAYNNKNYTCHGHCPKSAYVDKTQASIFEWLKHNKINTDLTKLLKINDVYDAFVKYFCEVEWV